MKKVLVVLLIYFNAMTAYAGVIDDVVKNGRLRVGLTPTYMPFEMTNKKGEIVGFEVDILKAMAKAMGVKLEFVPVSNDSVIPGLLIGKFDMIATGMTINPQRNLRINFTQPFIETGQTILIRKDLANKIKSYKDLNDTKYKITSQIGTTGEIVIKKYIAKAKYYSYNSEAEAVLEVANGRADAFVFDVSYNVVALHKLGSDKLVHLNQPITYEPIAFAIRKGDYDSINWINNFLNQIKHDGTYEYIYNKWFNKINWLEDMD